MQDAYVSVFVKDLSKLNLFFTKPFGELQN